jgi:hypothetical protein
MPGGGTITVRDGGVGLPHADASNAPATTEVKGRARTIVVGRLTISAGAS